MAIGNFDGGFILGHRRIVERLLSVPERLTGRRSSSLLTPIRVRLLRC